MTFQLLVNLLLTDEVEDILIYDLVEGLSATLFVVLAAGQLPGATQVCIFFRMIKFHQKIQFYRFKNQQEIKFVLSHKNIRFKCRHANALRVAVGLTQYIVYLFDSFL